MSYTIENSHAKNSGGDFVLEVNVMRMQGAPTDLWDKQYNYIVDALDQAYNDNRVPGILARKIDTDANLGCSSLLVDGNTWLDNNNWGDGLYLWVGECNDNPFASDHEGGWDSRTQAFVHADYYPTVHETAVSGIMEALHPYLYNLSCTDVQTEAGGSEDHQLGKVRLGSNRFGEFDLSTPMLGHYGKDKALAGNCDQWDDKEGYTEVLTDCTLKSLEYSWNHAAGNH